MKILKDLFEGLHFKEDPETKKKTIHYSDHGDDDPRLKSFTSTSGSGYARKSSAKIVGGQSATYEEETDLQHHIKKKPGVLQHYLPIFTGFAHDSPPPNDKEGRKQGASDEELENMKKYSIPFLHAMKGINSKDRGSKEASQGADVWEDLDFDPKSLNKFIAKGAADSVNRMKHKVDFSKYDQVVIIPMPSSKDLSKRFKKSIEKEVRKNVDGDTEVIVSDGLVSKNKFPKIGYTASLSADKKNLGKYDIHRESVSEGLGVERHYGAIRPKVNPMSKTAGNKEHIYTHRGGPYEGGVARKVLYNSPAQLKNASEDEIRKHAQLEYEKLANRANGLKKKIKDPRTDMHERNKLKKVLHATNIALNDPKLGKENTLKNLENKMKSTKKHGWSGEKENDDKMSISSLGAGRRFVHDFTSHDPNHPHVENIQDKSKKTLIIITDDNVYTGSTTDDFYKHLFKAGLIHKNTDAVVAAIQMLSGSTSDFRRHYKEYHTQHDKNKKTNESISFVDFLILD